jgi:hypothetical protein
VETIERCGRRRCIAFIRGPTCYKGRTASVRCRRFVVENITECFPSSIFSQIEKKMRGARPPVVIALIGLADANTTVLTACRSDNPFSSKQKSFIGFHYITREKCAIYAAFGYNSAKHGPISTTPASLDAESQKATRLVDSEHAKCRGVQSPDSGIVFFCLSLFS